MVGFFVPSKSQNATMIDGKLYDITGKLKRTDNKWVKWDEYLLKEPSYSEVIIRDCILKV